VHRFIRFLLKHRTVFGIVLLFSLALAIYSARTLRLRFQFRDFYDYPANPQLSLFKKDTQDFGDPAGFVVAMIETDDVFRQDVLDYIGKLTTRLAPQPIFSRVQSLTNVHAIRGQGDDVVSGALLADRPGTAAARLELRRFALQSPLLLRRLVSSDGKVTAVLAEMRTPATFATIAEQRQASNLVQSAILEIPAPKGVRVRITGSPAVEVGVTDALVNDEMTLVPGATLVLAIMLFVAFRSFHGILLCMAAVGTATIWTAGLFALLNRPVDIIGSLIPITILVYGAVDPIFVFSRVLQKLDAGHAHEDAIVEALSELALPCFLTSLTTAIGFAVFVHASSLSIRYFGGAVAVGVILAWLTSITVLPILLAIAPTPARHTSRGTLARQLDRGLCAVWKVLRPRGAQVVAGSAILIAIGGWLAKDQHVDNVYVEALPKGKTLSDVRALERSLSGVLRVIVHLEGPTGIMQRPDVLKAGEKVTAALAREHLVTHSSSLATLVAEANQAFLGGDPRERHVPASSSLIAQYLALIDPADLSDFVTQDNSKSHIDILLEDRGSEQTRAFVSRLRRTVKAAGFDALGVSAQLTGNGVVGYEELDSVVAQLIAGFVTAFGAIVVLEWLAFRSLRIALISVVPNVLPAIACFLCLRMLHINLKIESALVLCISIGGLFNTTIHFAARVLQRREQSRDSPDQLILHALRAVGPPALFTAVTLSAGFAVLLVSTFPGLRALGLLLIVTLLIGFVADMIITPILIRVSFNWGSPVARPRARTSASVAPRG
jgi:uncharacterized protein